MWYARLACGSADPGTRAAVACPTTAAHRQRSATRSSGCSRCSAFAQHSRQSGKSAMLENVPQRQLALEDNAHPRHHLHRPTASGHRARKKSSCRPTCSTCNSSCQICASALSISPCGGAYHRAGRLRGWRGSALRSTFPLAVSGNRCSTTNAAGTMYAGTRSRRCARRQARIEVALECSPRCSASHTPPGASPVP